MIQPTTIQCSVSTKQKLKGLKNHPEETMENLLVRLIQFFDEDDEISKEDIDDMKKSIDNIAKGKVKSLSEIRKKYSKK